MKNGDAAEVALLEALERDASADFWAAAPDEARRAYGIAHRAIGDGVLLTAERLDGSIMFNRLLGYGATGAVRAEGLDDAIAAFDRAGVKTWAIQVAPTARGLAELGAARGLEPHPRPWVKFARGPEPMAASGGLAVRPTGAADVDAFGAVFCASYEMPAGIGPWVAALVGRPRWHCFLSWDGQQPVGVGALFVARPRLARIRRHAAEPPRPGRADGNVRSADRGRARRGLPRLCHRDRRACGG
jgi:hypothetical protein